MQSNLTAAPPIAAVDLETATLIVRDDFEGVDALVSSTTSLVAQGDLLTQRIQEIKIATQGLSRLGDISAQGVSQLTQDLQRLLTTIAPNIAEYNGRGLSKSDFDNAARPFLAPFEEATRMRTILPIVICISLFTPAFCLGLMGYTALIYSAHTTDDQDDVYGNSQEHYHSVYQRKQLHTTGIIELTLASILMAPVIISIIRYLACPTPATLFRDNISTAVAGIYSDFCLPRKTLADVQNQPDVQAKYFFELAVKIYAESVSRHPLDGYQHSYGKVEEILSEFSEVETLEGQKFKRMLTASSPKSMRTFCDRLLEVQMEDGATNAWLTPQAAAREHEGMSLQNIIDKLRNSLNLEQRWPVLDNTARQASSFAFYQPASDATAVGTQQLTAGRIA